MCLYFKKLLPTSMNAHIWKYRFAYVQFSQLVSASLFVKELEVWFKSIADLVSIEEGQVRGHMFTPQKMCTT